LAKGLGKYYNKEPWIRGTITKFNLSGRRDFYAPYQVELVTGRQREKYFILEDTDEYICRVDATPRERFFDAIEEDCACDHLKYLVQEFDLDVASFSEMVIDEMIQNASYEVVLVLEEDLVLDVMGIKDSQGRTLLHRIASSRKVSCFIEKAIANYDLEEYEVNDLAVRSMRSDIVRMIENYSIATIVHKLARSIDLCLSSDNGNVFANLCDLLSRFRRLGMSDGSIINRLVDFRRIGSKDPPEKWIHGKLAPAGKVRNLRWLCEAVPAIRGWNPFERPYCMSVSRANTDESTQPELFTKNQMDKEDERVSFVSVTVHGRRHYSHYGLGRTGFKHYSQALLSWYDTYVNQLGIRKHVSLEKFIVFTLGDES
jgi:hypothetical protein